MAVKLGNGNWAVKEDKLLAYNDNSGLFFNKEFDFSRGTSATYVAKDGLIKTAGIQPNIVNNGDFATDSDWTVTQSGSDTITIENGYALFNCPNNSNIFISQGGLLTVGKTYKASVDLLSIDSGSLQFAQGGGATISGSPSINTVGTHTFTFVAATATFAVKRKLGAPNLLNAKIDNVSVQEIQTDTPRIDFTNDTKGHLLLEPQRTNVIENSEVTSTWTYTEFGSGSAGTITTGKTDMFGGTNAVQIDFPADTENIAFRFGQSTSSISSGSVATSVYIKLVESGSKTLQLRASSAVVSLINVNSTDFVRYEMTGTKNASEAFNLKLRPSEGTSSGGFSIILCQPQEEVGDYPTSYIPTTGAASTRNRDVCNNSGSAQDFNDSEGVLFVETEQFADGDYQSVYIVIANSTETGFDNSLLIQHRNNGQLRIYADGTGTPDVQFLVNIDLTQNLKIAVQYKENDYKLFINGTKYDLYLTPTQPALTGLDSIDFSYDSGNGWLGKVRNLQVFTEALTDEQLQELTS